MINKTQRPKFTSPAEAPEHIKMLFGGPEGWGKTFFTATVGKGNKVLILDTENGTVTLNHPAYRSNADSTEIENIHVLLFDEFDLDPADPDPAMRPPPLSELKDKVLSTLDWVIRTRNEEGYTLVALDSFTELQEKFIRLHGAPDGRQRYGDWASFVGEIMNRVKALPTHFIGTTRLDFSEDNVFGRDMVHASISPGARRVLGGNMHTLAFGELVVKGPKTVRQINLQHTVRAAGKDRMGLPDKYENPTFRSFIEDVRAARSGEAPATPDVKAPSVTSPGKKGSMFPARRYA